MRRGCAPDLELGDRQPHTPAPRDVTVILRAELVVFLGAETGFAESRDGWPALRLFTCRDGEAHFSRSGPVVSRSWGECTTHGLAARQRTPSAQGQGLGLDDRLELVAASGQADADRIARSEFVDDAELRFAQ
jgi:hypothetical protein